MEEFVTGERPMREPDRILATILFTDIVFDRPLANARRDEVAQFYLTPDDTGR